jgi:hypothetical protein
MTRPRLIGLVAATLLAAAIATDAGDPTSQNTNNATPRPVQTPELQRTPTPPRASRAAVDRQDRTSSRHRRREARAFDTRPLLNVLPVRRDGVRLDVAGLAADGRRALLAIDPGRRARGHALAVYRHLLAAARDSGRTYSLRWRR